MFEKKENLVKFGKKLQDMRKKRGFSASSVAMAAKITRHQLSAYENGRVCMAINKFDKIADALILTADERRELYNLYELARAEAYKSFSKVAISREEIKRKKQLLFIKKCDII